MMTQTKNKRQNNKPKTPVILSQQNKEISRGNAYERYKTSTRAFRDGLAKLVPSRRLETVSDLAHAVDSLNEATQQNNEKLMILETNFGEGYSR